MKKKRKSFVCNVSYCEETGQGHYEISEGGDPPREIAIDVIKILAKAYNVELSIMNEWEVAECE